MEQYVPLKTRPEIARMRIIGQAIAGIFPGLAQLIRPGIETEQIARYCCDMLERAGIEPATEGMNGFPGKICISVNHIAAHGIPGDYLLCENDMLTVDITGRQGGWYGDAAWTYIAGKGSPVARRLLKASWLATIAGLAAVRAGNRLGDVGHAIEKTAKRYGCSVIKNCVGHGIGKSLHEEPSVMPCGKPHTDRPIVPGMVFTVEPVLTTGCGKVAVLKDGHELHATDRELCAQFEHTVAVTSDSHVLLTEVPEGRYESLDFPPFI